MDTTLSMIGLALRAGRLEAGEEPAGEACREKRCRLLLVACDAAENTRRRAEHFAREGQCLSVPLPFTREELGNALGRSSCAVAAVTELGLAQAIAGKLAARDPAQYEQTAQRLRLKAERAAQRRERKAGGQQQGGGKRAPVKYRKKS